MPIPMVMPIYSEWQVSVKDWSIEEADEFLRPYGWTFITLFIAATRKPGDYFNEN